MAPKTRSKAKKATESSASTSSKKTSPSKLNIKQHNDDSFTTSSEEDSPSKANDQAYIPECKSSDSSLFNSQSEDDQISLDTSVASDISSKRKIQTAFKDSEDGSLSHSKTLPSILVVLTLAIMIYYTDCLHEMFSPTVQEVNKTRLNLYQEKIKVLQDIFPSQNSRLWKIVRHELARNIVLEDPHQPAILMLASDQDGHRTAQCLAFKLADAFSRKCQQHVVVDGSLLKHLRPEDAKLRIDKKISDAFLGGSCASTVVHFEEIPAFATNVFYQFCENDNAPFKNVSIIFTVQVKSEGLDNRYENLAKYPQKWDMAIDDFLTHSLSNRDPRRMTVDLIGGLLSRITQSVVWVAKEDDLIC